MPNKKVARDNPLAPFRLFANRYSSLGLSVFPCKGEDGKKPAVKWGIYQNSLPPETTTSKWIEQLGGCNIAIITGTLSGITVIDSDNPNMKLNDLFDLCGVTPLVVGTPRGGYHLYFRHNGESNTPPKNISNIDVRGRGGYVIAPPSINPSNGNSYHFIEGGFQDIECLPYLKPNFISAENTPISLFTEGERNRAIFTHLIEKAADCTDLDNLTSLAQDFNQKRLSPPLLKEEVDKTVKSAWSYKEKGKLFSKGQQTINYPISRIRPGMYDHPRAAVLYADLLSCHGGLRTIFAIGHAAYAKRSGWDEKTTRAAIKTLVELMLIRVVHKGGAFPGDATLYEFT